MMWISKDYICLWLRVLDKGIGMGGKYWQGERFHTHKALNMVREKNSR